MDKPVDEWLRQDRDPETRKEIQKLWENSDVSELEARLCKREQTSDISYRKNLCFGIVLYLLATIEVGSFDVILAWWCPQRRTTYSKHFLASPSPCQYVFGSMPKDG